METKANIEENEKKSTEECVEQAKIRYYKEKAIERLKKETRLKFIKAVYDILDAPTE